MSGLPRGPGNSVGEPNGSAVSDFLHGNHEIVMRLIKRRFFLSSRCPHHENSRRETSRRPLRWVEKGRAHSKEVHRSIFVVFTLLIYGMSQRAWAEDHHPQLWKNNEQGWVVEARECDRALCAFLVSYPAVSKKPPNNMPRDVLNPDPARREIPLCGMQLIGGFKPSPQKQGSWDNGWVYDPHSGRTYAGTITSVDASTIKLRGYVGVPLFGQTITLHRVSDVPRRCTQAQATR